MVIPECEIEHEKAQINITTVKISKNQTLKIYDESGLSTTTSETKVNKDNSQSCDDNSTKTIPKVWYYSLVVTSISVNTEDDICDSAYLIT